VNALEPIEIFGMLIGCGESHPSRAELFDVADSQRHNSLVCGSKSTKPRSLDSLHVIV
jgi:hypothetical protein